MKESDFESYEKYKAFHEHQNEVFDQAKRVERFTRLIQQREELDSEISVLRIAIKNHLGIIQASEKKLK
jgi:hypothetical protein